MSINHSDLYRMIMYKPPINFSINAFIYEYDLSKANISALRNENVIDDETYDRLYHADRMQRQIEIGLMEKNNKEITKLKKKGIQNAKRQLFASNQIQDWEVLSIKNDAVFIIGRELPYMSFGKYYNFVKKNTYTVFLKLMDIEIYYFDTMVNDGLQVSIDIKGINDELIPLHEHGMISLIIDVCSSIQRERPDITLRKLSEVYEKYIKRELPIDYYRELNYMSKYVFRSPYSSFYMDYIPQEQASHYINGIDIECNLMLIRELMNIVSSIYITNNSGRR